MIALKKNRSSESGSPGERTLSLSLPKRAAPLEDPALIGVCPAGAAFDIAFFKINIGAVFRGVLHLHTPAFVNEAVVAIPVELLHGLSGIAGPTFYSVIFAIFLQAPFFAAWRVSFSMIHSPVFIDGLPVWQMLSRILD